MIMKQNAFDAIIKTGIRQADEVQSNLDEIQDVFKDLDTSIKKTLGSNFSIVLVTPSGIELFFNLILKQNIPDDPQVLRGSLIIKNKDEKVNICNWRQDREGYPFVLITQGTQYECLDKESLIIALSEIFSSGSLWLKIRNNIVHNNSLKDTSVKPASDTKKNDNQHKEES
ncbi:hypothetical protein [Enterobacter asburiae]|uniref:hypothetical protein n=1 Tax=Enterobacter asburiae TaxID=61645 RepID=UPI0011D1976F|nr:hypothetical protein [Enterobacter asburiae]